MHTSKPLWGILATICLIMVVLLTAACQTSNPTSAGVPATQAASQSSAYSGKKILFINSYHMGYEFSDGIERGVHTVLDSTGVTLKFVRMDTKNHADEEFRQQAGQAAKAEFDAFKPDLVISSDDNAASYFVAQYLQKSTVPVLHLAINWDASMYNFDASHITGMVEIDPIVPMLSNLKPYAKGNRVGYVTIGTETEVKAIEVYNKRFLNSTMKSYVVHTFADFKDAFLKAQNENDMVILGNNAGSSDKWDDAVAIPFFTQNTRIPTGSVRSWMTPYTMVTVAKDPDEFGEWAAQTALRIFDGTPVSSIPTVENKKAKLSLNLDIAQRLEIVFTPTMLRNATIYSKKAGS